MVKKTLLLFLFILNYGISYAQDFTNEALAYQYYQNGEYEKAATLFESLFNKTKSNSYFELYSNSLLKIKKYEELEKSIKKLIKQFPNQYYYQIVLAKTYQDSGKSTEANKLFNQIIEQYATNELQTRELANLLYRFENYDFAIKAFLNCRKTLKNEQLFGYELLSIYRAKKDKPALIEEFSNQLALNPLLLMQAKSVFSNLFTTKGDYTPLQSALLKKIQKDPQNEALNNLLIWQYIQQQAYEMALRQLIALDKRSKNADSEIFNAAQIFAGNNAYPTAIRAFEYLVSKGPESDWYITSKIQLINCQYELVLQNKIEQSSLQKLATDFKQITQQYGVNNRTVFAIKKLANLQAYYLHQLDSAEITLEKALKVPNLTSSEAATLKIDLGDIYLLHQQAWEALLVYEQVAKENENTIIGHEAQFRSAQLSFYQGNFSYAKSQADVLKTSTSQLIANDALNLSLLISDHIQNKDDSLALIIYAKAEMQQKFNQFDKALQTLDSVTLSYPNSNMNDAVLISKSKIYTKQFKYKEAELQLQNLINNYTQSIWADDAIFSLAELYEQKLDNKQKAQELYKKLITNYPESILTNEARKRYRNLRGDNLGA